MSHSQFHSIETFILRHAWLNLWDKHMTTGRINQVTPCSDTQFIGNVMLLHLEELHDSLPSLSEHRWYSRNEHPAGAFELLIVQWRGQTPRYFVTFATLWHKRDASTARQQERWRYCGFSVWPGLHLDTIQYRLLPMWAGQNWYNFPPFFSLVILHTVCSDLS